MVAIVDQLEKRQLLERKPHARDRRVRNLHLTTAGRKLLKRAEQQAVQFDQRVTESLDEKELRQLLSLLDRIAVSLEFKPGAHAALRER
jgi:DNA-binding MarR family transcriptional regulator